MDKDKKADAEEAMLGMSRNIEIQMVQKGIYRVERTYDCLAANAAEKKAQRRKIARF